MPVKKRYPLPAKSKFFDKTYVACPICAKDITDLTLNDRTRHAEACLDSHSTDSVSSEPDLIIIEDRYSIKSLDDGKDTEDPSGLDNFSVNSVEQDIIEISQVVYSEVNDGELSDDYLDASEGESKLVKTCVTASHEASSSISPNEQSKSNDKVKPKRTPPFYKTMHFDTVKFAVDGFCYGDMSVNAYFLTHYHSDHFGGLNRKWSHGPIYCTPSTGRLAIKFLGVSPEFIICHDFNQEFDVNGVTVTFLEANHCPGSALILFDSESKTILHTGDFRASTELTANICRLRPFYHEIYLDTTYLSPRYTFPPQIEVVSACAKYCVELQSKGAVQRSQRTVTSFFRPISQLSADPNYKPCVFVGSYTIGKERLAIEIAQQLGTQIYANSKKMDILRLIGDPTLDALLSENGLNCQVHIVGMFDLSLEKLEAAWKSILCKHFSHLVAFVPTGWTHRQKGASSTFGVTQLEQCRSVKGPIHILKVPYSEHSSFKELEHFCTSTKWQRCIPTVGTSPDNSLHVRQWISKWRR